VSNSKRLLSHYAGRKEYFHWNEDGKNTGYVIETVDDVEPIIERAKMLSEQTPGKDFRHVACIPPHVFDQACREGWQNDRERWKKWANDPDNRVFRTWPGKL
jgi:hypothetical protein